MNTSMFFKDILSGKFTTQIMKRQLPFYNINEYNTWQITLLYKTGICYK